MRTLYQMAGLVAGGEPAADGAIVFAASSDRERRPPAWVTVQCESC